MVMSTYSSTVTIDEENIRSVLFFLGKDLCLKSVHIDAVPFDEPVIPVAKTIALRLPNILHYMKGGQHSRQLILNSKSVTRICIQIITNSVQ